MHQQPECPLHTIAAHRCRQCRSRSGMMRISFPRCRCQFHSRLLTAVPPLALCMSASCLVLPLSDPIELRWR